MCKNVYLTSRCFDRPSREFINALELELRKRDIEVFSETTCKFKMWFKKHKTFGIAIAIDFFHDGKNGCSLTLNKKCSNISRDFAYTLSNKLDEFIPRIKWRDFKFVDSYNKEWYRFFNKVSSTTKVIFYLCTANNPSEYDDFETAKDDIVNQFADEIVRCLRANYDYVSYMKSVKIANIKYNHRRNKKAYGMAE